MQDIFEMGKQKKSRYLSYQIKEAPRLDRGACSYSKEFFNKPALDFVSNKELAQDNARTKAPAKTGKTMTTTQYSLTFGKDNGVSQEQRLGARRTLAFNDLGLTDTLNGCGGLAESRSSGHQTFACPPGSVVKTLNDGTSYPAKDSLGVASDNHAFQTKSLYGGDFMGKSLTGTLRPYKLG
eukprot:TRINITY_DN13300_c0_g1_i3.p2 TRINITY_DN13300_c0_g1~~TRINITY_DN13300_c0_g1_i3.p2  ORF type:complete len:181 (+),score=43.72 TRINITY_DN13300_c0_g1_i3:628-1170(+)